MKNSYWFLIASYRLEINSFSKPATNKKSSISLNSFFDLNIKVLLRYIAMAPRQYEKTRVGIAITIPQVEDFDNSSTKG
ncbi:hypothetical protein [Flavivirga aquatica]|uniref:hypothetical protein n=1 Tax=Flavivirga aquatica TaxID=1849968 RepID=UPI000F4EBCEF|nr:hypothetical protein [Flavivirga aquatica]